MYEILQSLAAALGVPANVLVVAGLAVGSFLAFLGLFYAPGGDDEISRRMQGGGRARGGQSAGASQAVAQALLREADVAPTGVMKAFIPEERVVRSRIQRQLMQAGLGGRNAVRNFYLFRTGFGLVLPALLLAGILLNGPLAYPEPVAKALGGLTRLQTMQILAALIVVGFYGPAYWLRLRTARRQTAIEQAFPNVLDMLQVAVEAGLGFDAAMQRVAEEIRGISPEIADELQAAQNEVLAGRDRERAYFDMAERMGIDEAHAFVNVVQQSMRFGTSMSTTLTVYADEMRERRELKAQEKANKLPVQMSAVMASLMLPALLMVSLGPVVIRYMRYFAGS